MDLANVQRIAQGYVWRYCRALTLRTGNDETARMEIQEIKRTLDGRVQTFTTEGLVSTTRLAVVRFDFKADRRVQDFLFPQGGFTLGFFWAYRNYLLYRFCKPDGSLIAHRFDIIRQATLKPGCLTYDDLAVDIWVTPDGLAIVEDEDEFAAFIVEGKVSTRDIANVERTKQLLLRAHNRIFREADEMLEALQLPTPIP